ncbi:hypothetical protein GGTG_12630, partial [Gaeumannomyces tritici R3-111a-1]
MALLKLLRYLFSLFFFFFFFSFAAARVTARIALDVIIGKSGGNAIAIKGAAKMPFVIAISISGFGVSKNRLFFRFIIISTLYRREVIAFPGPYKAVIRIAYT